MCAVSCVSSCSQSLITESLTDAGVMSCDQRVRETSSITDSFSLKKVKPGTLLNPLRYSSIKRLNVIHPWICSNIWLTVCHCCLTASVKRYVHYKKNTFKTRSNIRCPSPWFFATSFQSRSWIIINWWWVQCKCDIPVLISADDCKTSLKCLSVHTRTNVDYCLCLLL